MSQLWPLRLIELKSAVAASDVANIFGWSFHQAKTISNDLLRQGMCVERTGKLTLTDLGRTHLVELLRIERFHITDPEIVVAAYSTFSTLNRDVKRVITAWQLRHGELNDHRDALYDRAIVSQLVQLHYQVPPLIDRLVPLVPRLGLYTARLDRAIGLVRDGNGAWMDSPLLDSYHTVWFELHEDLLTVAGRDRSVESDEDRA